MLGDFENFHDGVTSLDFPAFFFGNDANAWPAVLLDGKGPLQAVQVGGLVLSLLLGGLFTISVG